MFGLALFVGLNFEVFDICFQHGGKFSMYQVYSIKPLYGLYITGRILSSGGVVVIARDPDSKAATQWCCLRLVSRSIGRKWCSSLSSQNFWLFRTNKLLCNSKWSPSTTSLLFLWIASSACWLTHPTRWWDIVAAQLGSSIAHIDSVWKFHPCWLPAYWPCRSYHPHFKDFSCLFSRRKQRH